MTACPPASFAGPGISPWCAAAPRATAGSSSAPWWLRAPRGRVGGRAGRGRGRGGIRGQRGPRRRRGGGVGGPGEARRRPGVRPRLGTSSSPHCRWSFCCQPPPITVPAHRHVNRCHVDPIVATQPEEAEEGGAVYEVWDPKGRPVAKGAEPDHGTVTLFFARGAVAWARVRPYKGLLSAARALLSHVSPTWLRRSARVGAARGPGVAQQGPGLGRAPEGSLRTLALLQPLSTASVNLSSCRSLHASCPRRP